MKLTWHLVVQVQSIDCEDCHYKNVERDLKTIPFMSCKMTYYVFQWDSQCHIYLLM